ncbi:hypothetical protein PRUPE_1G236300 [Prunus persica]|uniref:Uncharacterized protein n=1 Tax=Prunus persica TaxID=3760 RepID=A0A251R3B9_PRUPE|nr:hypothetical protein PRUPE_1G236300 [Prunus persica]
MNPEPIHPCDFLLPPPLRFSLSLSLSLSLSQFDYRGQTCIAQCSFTALRFNFNISYRFHKSSSIHTLNPRIAGEPDAAIHLAILENPNIK